MYFLSKFYNFFQKRNEFYLKYKYIYLLISLTGLLFWVFTFKWSVLDANNIPTGSMTPTLKIGDLLFVNKMRYALKLPFSNIILWKMDTPKRGDIVTFTPPERAGLHGKTLVKRVIGIPGDTIQVLDNEITVSNVQYPVSLQKDRNILKDLDYPRKDRNNSLDDFQLFKEKIIDPKTKTIFLEHYMMKVDITKLFYVSNLRSPNKTWTIPAGYYMMMGDNRDDSEDSREWGLVPIEQIHGKVFIAYFSINWGYRLRYPLDHNNILSANPLLNFFQIFTGKYPEAYIRWNRIGQRIY